MSEMLQPEQVTESRQRLTELGHVGIKGLYSPDIAQSAIEQLPYLGKLAKGALGELRAAVSLKPAIHQPDLQNLLNSFELKASELGMPWQEDADYFLQYISMLPGTKGRKHRDRKGIAGVVGITTPRGSSRLLTEDGADYSLTPGDAVFLDQSRNIKHQGMAGGDGERIGFVIAKEIRISDVKIRQE